MPLYLTQPPPLTHDFLLPPVTRGTGCDLNRMLLARQTTLAVVFLMMASMQLRVGSSEPCSDDYQSSQSKVSERASERELSRRLVNTSSSPPRTSDAANISISVCFRCAGGYSLFFPPSSGGLCPPPFPLPVPFTDQSSPSFSRLSFLNAVNATYNRHAQNFFSDVLDAPRHAPNSQAPVWPRREGLWRRRRHEALSTVSRRLFRPLGLHGPFASRS